MKNRDDLVSAFCNNCCRETNHDSLYYEESKSIQYEGEGGAPFDINWIHTLDLIKCRGCEEVSLMRKTYSDDFSDFDPTYYPPRKFRKEPRWLILLDFENPINKLIKEIYIAIGNNSVYLPTMGIRSLIEHIMIEKVGDNGSFKDNLNQFEKQGFISPIQRKVIKPIIEMGHAVTHRSVEVSNEELISILDVTENIIESIYINEKKINRFINKIPKRK